jgi:TPR repeat protein
MLKNGCLPEGKNNLNGRFTKTWRAAPDLERPFELSGIDRPDQFRKLLHNAAIEWFQKGAAQGDVYAELILGRWCAAGGDGFVKDSIEAVGWITKAASHGNAEAQNLPGERLSSGSGLPKDSAKAAEWYRKSEDQGIASSQFALAVHTSCLSQSYFRDHMVSRA